MIYSYKFISKIFLSFVIYFLLVSPIRSEDDPETFFIEPEEIPILSSDPQDREWKVLYIDPNGYLSDSKRRTLLKQIFDNHSGDNLLAVFIYGGYNSDVETNRKIKKTYKYTEYSEYVEEVEIKNYISFLRIYCRIPTSTKYKLEKEGKLDDYKSRENKEIQCEKDLISRTWKGNGIHFWIHKYYYNIPDVLIAREIPAFLLYLFTVLSISFFSLFILFLIIYFIYINKPSISIKLLSILGSLVTGSLLIAFAFSVYESSTTEGPGLSYYMMSVFLISGLYTILCFVPFWGLSNYLLLDDDDFPLWLILLGFFLAPLLVLAAGGMGGGGSSSTTSTKSSGSNTSSGNGTSSTVSSGSGNFGGGGASGQW